MGTWDVECVRGGIQWKGQVSRRSLLCPVPLPDMLCWESAPPFGMRQARVQDVYVSARTTTTLLRRSPYGSEGCHMPVKPEAPLQGCPGD
eukprot:CAMPEP_0174324298 /NCGR_PEP_ID=MMETSP0810-20121108/12397_1 /TAXON_ID=73025 ORGANISM="Eutreptiella gymnastica-like, Strain CCMP1594" /NCGR_SAMPLE_ID=MMETSP0810 /ASSEMBLY_ACC=CAM_ASM_000659 /LENGTH=89 /DNA_ID=CAMNT_0015437045 /DNA_START=90 /DNA_END=360 /DNA_ORIENTATION=+